MNTRLDYMYRNASNYSRVGSVVFEGATSAQLVQRFSRALESSEFFIADQVRVPELFFEDNLDPNDDHCWHELAAFESTDDGSTDEFARTIESFVVECEAASHAGWRIFDPADRPRTRASSDLQSNG